MNFELKEAYQVGQIKNLGGTHRKMFINVRAGVVGLPDEAKYKFPEYTISFEFEVDETTTTAQVNELITTTAEQYVAENYPSI